MNESQSEGDTQPISPSVYEQYNTRSKEQRAARLSRLSDGTQSHPHTLQQGESGHVDLLAAFEQPSPPGEKTPCEIAADEDELDPLSQHQDIRAEIFPESRRFQAPKTPASQGKKRKRDGESSSKKASTPRLPVNPFAGQNEGMDGLMSASQLFQATQAATSPLANAGASDGLSERPSPDVCNLQRPSTAGTFSSPVRLPRANVTRAATEPQTVYITMKESQENRERLIQERNAKQALLRGEESDDDFDDDPALRRRLRKRRYELEARDQFAKVAALSEAAMRNEGRSRGIQELNARGNEPSSRLGRQAHEPVFISDDVSNEDRGGSITEDETEQEDDEEEEDIQEDDDIDELAEENKENVEVPGTILRRHPKRSQNISSQPTPSHRPVARLNVISPSKRSVQVLGSSQTSKPRELTMSAEVGTQPDAIADSQTTQTPLHAKPHGGRPGVRAFSEPRSSLDSRILVPQSQSSQGSKVFRPSMTEQANSRNLQSESAQNGPTENAPNSFSNNNRVQTKTISTDEQAQSESPNLAPKGLTQLNNVPNLDNTEGINSSGGLIPDSSNIISSPRTSPKSVSKVVSNQSIIDESRTSTLFHTAQELMLNSPSKLSSLHGQKRSQSAQPSPEKSKRFRSMSEIAADPSPPDVIGEVDVDVDILSNEDREFQKTIHGSGSLTHSRKRQKTSHYLALKAIERGPRLLPNFPSSPVPPPSSAISKITPVKSSVIASTIASSPPPSSAVSPVADKKNRDNKRQRDLQSIDETEVHQAPGVPNGGISEPGLQNTSAPKMSNAEVSDDDKIGPMGPVQSPDSGGTNRIQPSEISDSPIIAPNRVFAHFNGMKPAYHPATCLGLISGEDLRYSVRFDDGTVDTISAYGIKRLELQVGDIVKVDLPGTRTKNYVVEGMRDQRRSASPPDPNTPSRRGRSHSTNDAAFPETDIHGFATVLASPKQRTSLDGNQADSPQIAIPLTQIYFTQTMWTSFKNRQYIHVPNPGPAYTGLQTPSERPSTPSTPSSRTCRMRMSGLALTRSATSGAGPSEGMFGNMAFAITNVDRAEDNKRVKDLINSNGGLILENGFEDLFSIPALKRAANSAEDTASSFHLTSQAKDTGFTCLIADKHCRRAKFIQALALGIPCLATRWVSDCVAKQCVLPWAPYLLPSGESSFLGGATRSRNLQPFPAATGALSKMVETRPKLLEDASVLLIMDKSQVETMKQHPLITHALGASKVARAISVDEAMKIVSDAQALGQPWDWVFSYDKEKEVEKRLSGTTNNGKKRKRGRENEEQAPPIKKAKTKVVGNEFVIQSLILGMLIDH